MQKVRCLRICPISQNYNLPVHQMTSQEKFLNNSKLLRTPPQKHVIQKKQENMLLKRKVSTFKFYFSLRDATEQYTLRYENNKIPNSTKNISKLKH